LYIATIFDLHAAAPNTFISPFRFRFLLKYLRGKRNKQRCGGMRPSPSSRFDARPVNRGQRFRLILLILLFSTTALTVQKATAYVLEGPHWEISTISMQSSLGSPGGILSDGNTSWDAAAAPAFSAWNQYLEQTQIAVVTNPGVPAGQNDRVNTAAFAANVFGQSFGSSTLAVTLYHWSGSTMIEADILVNNRQSWDSYTGALRGAIDIRRVLVHELGHVLGLDHPDDHGQRVSAIMNSVVSNIESPTGDDINGAQALYGARTSAPPTPTATPIPIATPVPIQPSPSSLVTVSANPSAISEGGASTFTLTAAQPSTVDRTIRYSMTGRAINGTQYVLSANGQVTLPAGSTSVTVTLTSIPNSIRKGKKTAKMILLPGAGYQISRARAAVVTILNVATSLGSAGVTGPGAGRPPRVDADPDHSSFSRP
jgi:hypothetical protein